MKLARADGLYTNKDETPAVVVSLLSWSLATSSLVPKALCLVPVEIVSESARY